MRIAFGTDERTALTDRIKAALAERGHEVVVVGEGDPWPDVGRRVGEAVAGGRRRPGRRVLLDRHRRVDGRQQGAGRAGRAVHRPRHRGRRPQWNDANVLALGLRLTSPALADEMLDAFLSTDAEDDEAANIAKLG